MSSATSQNKNNTTPSVHALNSSPKERFVRNRKLWLAVLIIVLVILAGFVYWHSKKPTVSSSNGHVCSEQTLKLASRYLSPSNVAKLKEVVNNIQKTPNYQQDPNCLYPVVAYYINISDSHNGSMYLNKLEKVYKPSQGFSKYLGSTYVISTLKNDIKSIQANNKNIHLIFSGQP